jgi:hypothetical protein
MTTTATARLRDAASQRREFTPFYREKLAAKARREFRGKLRLSDLNIEEMSFSSIMRGHEPPRPGQSHIISSPNAVIGKIHPCGSFTYIGQVKSWP